MHKTVIVYGLLGGTLIAALKLVEYRFLVVGHSLEIYAGIVAAVFAALGIWLGMRLKVPPQSTVAGDTGMAVEDGMRRAHAQHFECDAARQQALGITPRELEILEAMADGLSNREIAARLFVSENTVKTHAARVFDKLSAKRRTQAVQLAKQHGLIA